MKKHHKVGGKPGRPAYRTPSSFRYKKSLENKAIKGKKAKLEATIEIRYNKDRKLDKRKI